MKEKVRCKRVTALEEMLETQCKEVKIFQISRQEMQEEALHFPEGSSGLLKISICSLAPICPSLEEGPIPVSAFDSSKFFLFCSIKAFTCCNNFSMIESRLL